MNNYSLYIIIHPCRKTAEKIECLDCMYCEFPEVSTKGQLWIPRPSTVVRCKKF